MANSAPPAARLLLEVCVDSADGLAAAIAGGAHRIELCAALAQGGLTPSAGLMKLAADTQAVRKGPVRAMIRPREGGFSYNDNEARIMRADIDLAAACGLEGVVLGATRNDGTPDEGRLAELVGHANRLGLKVAIHRAFDLAPDPLAALESAIAMKVDTLLTSGGARCAADGIHGLRSLVVAARGRIEILAGCGVTASNAAAIVATGVRALHASCSAVLPFAPSRAAELGYVHAGMRDTDPTLVRQLAATLTDLETCHVLR